MIVVRLPAKNAAQLTVVATAALVAVFPPPPHAVERWYADWLYPIIQANLTAISNRVSIPLFDIALVGVVGAMLVAWLRWLRRAKRERSLRPIGRALAGTLTMGAIVYLWFLAAWGLNYARPRLESTLPFDAARITPAAVRALAEQAIAQTNRTHAAGHAAGFATVSESPDALIKAFHEVERELGRPRPTVFAHPKRSIVSPYYRATAVSGQLAPFFLETLINPDLTGPERPYVLAHEWAHLAGYGPEDDASFVGLLAALRAGPAGEYSAWLELALTAVGQLQPVTQRLVMANLAEGPRRDHRAIYERVVGARVEAVDRVARSAYDRMLKSQGVEEGVESYSRVIHLVLGTDVLKIPSSPASAEATAGKQ
jgi:hypothetical protein